MEEVAGLLLLLLVVVVVVIVVDVASWGLLLAGEDGRFGVGVGVGLVGDVGDVDLVLVAKNWPLKSPFLKLSSG